MFRLLFLGLLLCSAPAYATAQEATQKLVIAVLGDSLTSGFELRGDQGYVQVLERELLAKGYNVDLRTAAIAGQSTRQGRDWVFIEPVLSADIVLLQLGGNDANYRVLPERIKENLDYMITNFQQRGQLVVFMANKFTPKYGQNYRAEIEDLFDAVARDYDLLFEPFIYQPLIDFQTLLPRAELLLEDGVHPNAAGVRELVAHSIPLVEKAIRTRRGN
ncbi:MAG: hypothetical protein CML80_01995 [Rhodobiaceae bacterium]|nr:hypothetical protein [Rhodobiaceae bacterium]OUT93863.1 MAG: hypothetical protein CBB89_02490 [Rhizobiales bacterium TMED29]